MLNKEIKRLMLIADQLSSSAEFLSARGYDTEVQSCKDQISRRMTECDRILEDELKGTVSL